MENNSKKEILEKDLEIIDGEIGIMKSIIGDIRFKILKFESEKEYIKKRISKIVCPF